MNIQRGLYLIDAITFGFVQEFTNKKLFSAKACCRISPSNEPIFQYQPFTMVREDGFLTRGYLTNIWVSAHHINQIAEDLELEEFPAIQETTLITVEDPENKSMSCEEMMCRFHYVDLMLIINRIHTGYGMWPMLTVTDKTIRWESWNLEETANHYMGEFDFDLRMRYSIAMNTYDFLSRMIQDCPVSGIVYELDGLNEGPQYKYALTQVLGGDMAFAQMLQRNSPTDENVLINSICLTIDELAAVYIALCTIEEYDLHPEWLNRFPENRISNSGDEVVEDMVHGGVGSDD